MSDLNPYHPTSIPLTPVDSRPIYLKAVRTYITISMFGGVLSIVAGMIAAAIAPDTRVFATFGVLLLFWSWSHINLLMDQKWTKEPEYPGASCELTVFLIWLFALGPSANAVTAASGAEDATANDLKWWFAVAIPMISISFILTLAFLRTIKYRPIDRVFNSYVYSSWCSDVGIIAAWWLFFA